MTTISIRGSTGNLARYFRGLFRGQYPLERLVFLAAHLVLSAGRIDPVMLKDLDIALFDSTGFRLLTEKEMTPLREKSKELDASIRQQLLGK